MLRRLISVGLPALIGAGVLYAGLVSTGAVDIGQQALRGVAEQNNASVSELVCAHHGPAHFIGSNNQQIAITNTLAGDKTKDPVYHDCQRLLVRMKDDKIDPKGKLRYLERAAVYATADLLLALEATMNANYGTGYVVATVFSGVAMPEAGIPFQLTCIATYIASVGSQVQAFAFGGDEETDTFCPKTYTPGNGAKLAIQRTQFPKLQDDKFFPSSARWQWNARSGTPYVGFTCGRAWCEVTAEDGSLPDPPNGDATETNFTDHIPGWSDQQFLSKEDKGKPDDVKPSELLGTISPTVGQALGFVKDSGYLNNWIGVANATIAPTTEGEGDYDDKFDLKREQQVRISLCQGDRVGCGLTEKADKQLDCKRKGGPDWENDKWYSRFERPGEKPRFLCSVGYKQDGAGYGGVRWRWVKGDEGMWIRCPKGCCELT